MDDSHDWTGRRLGPYHLDKRYEDLDQPGGQLYAQPPRRSPRERLGGRISRLRVRSGSLIAGALLLVVVVLWVRLPGSPEGVADRTDGSLTEPTFWLDQTEGTAGIGYPMPEAAYPEQMKPPCGGGGYVEIRGGCWVQTTQTVPCKGTAEYEGKCYVPVREKKSEPHSIKR